MTPLERKAALLRFYLACLGALLLAWLWPEFGIALWAILPCPDCCGPCVVSCSRCLNSEANCEYEVTVTGVTAHAGCAQANCTLWNATHLLTFTADSGGVCLWQGVTSICGATAPNFRINRIITGSKRYLTVQSGSGGLIWDVQLGTNTDGTSCLTINQALAVNSGGLQCTLTGSTCQVVSAP